MIGFLFKKSLHMLHVHLVLTIHGEILQPFNFCQCLNLRKVGEYGHTAKAFWPMMPIILLEDTVVTLR